MKKKKVTNADKLSLYCRTLKCLRELHPSYYSTVVKTDVETAYTIRNNYRTSLYLNIRIPPEVLIWKKEV